MGPIYKEASFPVHYREVEVQQIMDAVYKLRSIAITGLAGMGKSNVVRFVVSHPQVKQRYLKDRADNYAFVHVDCTSLAAADEASVLSEIAMRLSGDGIAPDPSAPDSTHPARLSYNTRHSLREQVTGLSPERHLVLFLDYFDEAAAKLDRSFFNYLFHLRNSRPRGNLCYVFATRRPMGHLGELQELLDDGCKVGPLSARDALESIERDEARLGCAFSPVQRQRLLQCTGRHPGFLKNASELLCSGKLDVEATDEQVARQLLSSSRVANLCQELWDDLTPSERRTLIRVADDITLPGSVDDADLTYLEQSGVVVKQADAECGLAVFSPLFETFVREVKSARSGEVRITPVFPNQARIETLAGEDSVTLAPKLFAVLVALAEARGQVLSTDEVIARVYGEDAVGVSDAALSQLIKRLRGALDRRAREMIGDPGYTCVETVRGVGYRLK